MARGTHRQPVPVPHQHPTEGHTLSAGGHPSIDGKQPGFEVEVGVEVAPGLFPRLDDTVASVALSFLPSASLGARYVCVSSCTAIL